MNPDRLGRDEDIVHRGIRQRLIKAQKKDITNAWAFISCRPPFHLYLARAVHSRCLCGTYGMVFSLSRSYVPLVVEHRSDIPPLSSQPVSLKVSKRISSKRRQRNSVLTSRRIRSSPTRIKSSSMESIQTITRHLRTLNS